MNSTMEKEKKKNTNIISSFDDGIKDVIDETDDEICQILTKQKSLLERISSHSSSLNSLDDPFDTCF